MMPLCFLQHQPARFHAIFAPLRRNRMYRGIVVLVIIIHGFLHIFKMLCQHKIGIAQGIVLIINVFRKPQPMFYYHRAAENFYHQAAPVQNQAGPFFLVQHTALALFIIGHNLPYLHGMFLR